MKLTDLKINGNQLGFHVDELKDQIIEVIETPEFQWWKLERQSEEPCPFLGLDTLELL